MAKKIFDSTSTVYTAGAMAFALFSGYGRTGPNWPLGKEAFRVATKAVNDSREARQQSIKQLIQEWKTAIATL